MNRSLTDISRIKLKNHGSLLCTPHPLQRKTCSDMDIQYISDNESISCSKVREWKRAKVKYLEGESLSCPSPASPIAKFMTSPLLHLSLLSPPPAVPLLIEPPSSSEEDLQASVIDSKEQLNVSPNNFNAKSAPTTPHGIQLSSQGSCPIPGAIQQEPKTPTHAFSHSDRYVIKQLSTSTPAMTQALSVSGGPAEPTGSVGAPASTSTTSSNQYLQTLSSSKARQKKFHRHFKQVSLEERVLDYYSCALVADILLQGHLYITRNYFAFYSNVFGYVTKLLIPMVDVIKVSKEKTVRIIPNAVGITTLDEKHVFGSLLSRDTTYKLMVQVWMAATHPDPVVQIEVPKVIKDDLDDSASGEILADEESSVSGSGNEGRSCPSIVPSVVSTPSFQKIVKTTQKISGPPLPVAPLTKSPKMGSLSRYSVILSISTGLLVLLFLSAGFLLYRIQTIQNHFVEFPIITNSDDIYEELLKWQSTLHSRSANEVHEFLNSNLNQLAKVRLGLETLSMLIFTNSEKEEIKTKNHETNDEHKIPGDDFS